MCSGQGTARRGKGSIRKDEESKAGQSAESAQDQPRTRSGVSYRFSHAIVRMPGESVVNGLRSVDRGAPSAKALREEHSLYIAALERAGLRVEPLPALEAFPDSVFVEDTALCLPEGAIVLRPGAATRSGEAPVMEPVLRSYFDDVRRIDETGSIDGGDILVTDSAVLIGLSRRTSQAGFEAVKAILADWGYAARSVAMPAQSLHLKSDCAVLDGDCVLATGALAACGGFDGLRVLQVPEGEEPAANAIRVNDRVFVPSGFPRTAAMLTAAGYDVEVLAAAEAAKLDAGLSCMSLRFKPSR